MENIEYYKSELSEYVGFLDKTEIDNMLEFMYRSVPEHGCPVDEINGLEFDDNKATLNGKAITLIHQGGYPLITIDYESGKITYISLAAIFSFLSSIDAIYKEAKDESRYDGKYFEMFFNCLITGKYVTYELFIGIHHLLSMYSEVFEGASVWGSEMGMYRLDEDDPNIKEYYSNYKDDTINSRVV